MRFVKRVVTVVFLFAVLLAAAAYLLPREVQVSRTTTIDAPPDTVFPLVNSLQEAATWSPWLELDPSVRLAYTGPDSGVGNRMAWRSMHPDVGSGSQEITESTANAHVGTALDFGEMGTATASYDLQPAGTGTMVTWSMIADMGMNPVARWTGLLMDRWVGDDFERGLINLKRVAEGR